nr:collagen alpha-2(I) chain-like [Setaria viridis]
MRDDPVRPKRADRVIPLGAPSAPSFSVRETGTGASSSPAGRGPPAARPVPRVGGVAWGERGERPAGQVGPVGGASAPGVAAGAHGQRGPPAARLGASGDLQRRGLGQAGAAGSSGGGERGRCGLGGRELRRGRAGAARLGAAGSSGGGGNRLAGGEWGDGSGWRR